MINKAAILPVFVLSATLCALGTVQTQERPVDAVKSGGRYSASDEVWVEYAGGCTASVESIECWDETGKVNKQLSELIAAPFLIDNSRELTFKFGRKNRFLLFKHPNDTSVSYRSLEGDLLSEFSGINNNRISTDIVSIAAAKSQSDVSVVLDLTSYRTNRYVRIPLTVGAKAEVDGKQYLLKSFRSLTKSEQKQVSPQGVGLQSLIHLVNVETNAAITSSLSFIDENEQGVYRLTREGKPVTQDSALFGYNGYVVDRRTYVNVLPASSNLGPGMMSNVNLKYVKALQLTFGNNKTVKFEGLRLDPLP